MRRWRGVARPRCRRTHSSSPTRLTSLGDAARVSRSDRTSCRGFDGSTAVSGADPSPRELQDRGAHHHRQYCEPDDGQALLAARRGAGSRALDDRGYTRQREPSGSRSATGARRGPAAPLAWPRPAPAVSARANSLPPTSARTGSVLMLVRSLGHPAPTDQDALAPRSKPRERLSTGTSSRSPMLASRPISSRSSR